MNALALQKGERIDLTKGASSKRMYVGAGWDITSTGGKDFDVDLFALVIGKDGKICSGNTPVVFFNNVAYPGLPSSQTSSIFSGKSEAETEAIIKDLFTKNNCIVHSGDNLTGKGDGDDEKIFIDFSKMPADADQVVICLNVYDAVNRNQNFGQISNCFVRVCDVDTSTELCKFDVSEDYSGFTGLEVAKLYFKDGEWKFQALANGFSGDINAFAQKYS